MMMMSNFFAHSTFALLLNLTYWIWIWHREMKNSRDTLATKIWSLRVPLLIELKSTNGKKIGQLNYERNTKREEVNKQMDRNMYLINAELNTFDLSAHSFMRDKILSCTIEKWPNFCEQMQPNLRGSLSLTMRQEGRRIYLLEIIQPFNVHHIQSKLNWNLKKLLTNNFNNQTLNWNWPNNSLICEQWMQQQQNKTAKRMALNSNFLYVDRSRCAKMYTAILSIHTLLCVGNGH